jgi:hypothetical protein
MPRLNANVSPWLREGEHVSAMVVDLHRAELFQPFLSCEAS